MNARHLSLSLFSSSSTLHHAIKNGAKTFGQTYWKFRSLRPYGKLRSSRRSSISCRFRVLLILEVTATSSHSSLLLSNTIDCVHPVTVCTFQYSGIQRVPGSFVAFFSIENGRYVGCRFAQMLQQRQAHFLSTHKMSIGVKRFFDDC